MASKKREDPFTPDPNRGVPSKKLKEYVSPVPKTPLRNVLTPERQGSAASLIHSASRRPTAELIPGSASRSRLATSFEALDDDDQEKMLMKDELIKKRKDRKNNLMSPVVGSSPKAALPQSLKSSKGTKKSASGTLISTPIASVISSDIANRPLHSSNGKPKMTAEQMNKVFEEWIKIAADNKINAKNTWNLALIDYFSELTFLKDGNSINFQKASCTLDGCVKIYASRVDSVVDETGKLINGLSEGNLKNSRYLKGEIGNSQDDEQHEENDGGDEDSERKKSVKKQSRHVSTLEKNPEALNLKQFDLEYSVDPLFKKTCAEFDENCSRGMLLLTLGLSSDSRVIFDSSSDPKLDVMNSERNSVMEIGSLKSKFASLISSSMERKLCPTFSEYPLDDTTSTKLNDKFLEEQLSKAMERMERINIEPITPQEPANNMMEIDGKVFDAPQTNFTTNNFDNNDFAPLMDDDYGAYPGDEDQIPNFSIPGLENFDVDSSDCEINLSEEMMEEVEEVHTNDNAAVSMLTYFDSNMRQAWAGPNHWKVRRPTMSRSLPDQSAPKQPNKKKDFALEFNDSLEIDIEALFTKPANSATITLSRTLIDERSQKTNLLPEDMHFSSNNFLRLFIKPSWRYGSSVRTSRRVLRPQRQQQEPIFESLDTPADAEQIGESFWAQHEVHPEGVAEVYYDPDMNPDAHDGVQFDGDYGGFDDSDGPDDDPVSLTQLSTVTNFGLDLVTLKAGVKVQRLAFSRVAKRVDVHKLKQAIWEEIDPSSTKTVKKFSDLVQSLDKTSYPKDGLKEVSVPYCFICLLHLANEHGLSIQSDGRDLSVSQQ